MARGEFKQQFIKGLTEHIEIAQTCPYNYYSFTTEVTTKITVE